MEEPFNRVITDCVGPLPKRNLGIIPVNQLTILCSSTRFPEAVPLKSIKAPKIVTALINFFTLVGLPKAIQSDQGLNLMSGVLTIPRSPIKVPLNTQEYVAGLLL